MKGLVEDPAEQAGVVRDLVRLLGLAGDLGFPDHHRIERRGDAKQMANRRSPEVDVQTVVVRKLALVVGEIGETAPEVKQEGVGVDPGFTAKVELDPVAGAEVDQLGESSEARELDQVLARKIDRQRRGGELIHVDASIRGADDTDTVQKSSSRQDSTRPRPECRHARVKAADTGEKRRIAPSPYPWVNNGRSPAMASGPSLRIFSQNR